MGQDLAGSRYADLPITARTLAVPGDFALTRKTGRIVVPLPDGRTIRFIPTSIEDNAGVATVHASLQGASLLLTSDGQRAFGLVSGEQGQYVIDTVGRKVVIAEAARVSSPEVLHGAMGPDFVIDVERSKQLLEESRANLASVRQRAKTLGDAAALEETVVDVAFFYEPPIAEREGLQSPRTRAQAGVDYTNDAYRQHQIPLRLRLVYVGAYPGSLPFDPFSSFVNNAEVRATADAYGADLVHLLFDYRPGLNYCGIAYLFGRYGSSALGCNVLNHVIAHEIGHNYGAQHDRANASLNWNIGLPIHQYNYGWVCGGRGTIMSYPGYPHLPHYSTPFLSNGGQPCGVPEGSSDAADNARAIDVMRTQVGAFRLEPSVFGTVRFATTDTLQLDEKQARTATVRVVRDGDLTREASVEVGAVDGTTTEGEDYAPLLTRLVFAPNQAEALVTIEVIDDEQYEPTPETFQVVLRYPRGLQVEGGSIAGSISSDDPDRGKAEFVDPAVGVSEAAGSLSVQLRRLGSTENALTVNVATSDETAKAGVDYQAVVMSVTFAPGENSRQLSLTINNDDIYQGYEAYRTFVVQLSGANLTANRSQRVFIFNDDVRRGRAQFETAAILVAENAGSVAVPITRVDGSEGPLSFSIATQDDSAVAGRDYLGIAGTATLQNGQAGGVLSIPLIDNARFDGNRVFRVTLSGDDVGEPRTLTVTVQNDDPDRGLAVFAAGTTQVSEKNGSVSLQVARIGGAEDRLTVGYATLDGSARAGEDYVATSGSLTFGTGVRSLEFRVPIIDDIDIYDPGKSFTVRLTGELLGAVTEATVAIQNDDPNRGKAQFAAATATVRENAGSVTLALQRIDGFEADLSVTYATSDGTGKAGADYTASSGQVTFGGGEASKSITVPVTNNSLVDGNRSFVVDLQQGPRGAVTRATVTIEDDERLGKAEFAAASVTVSESAGSAALQVRRVDGADGTIAVRYQTADGSGRSGVDYLAASGELTFAPGETAKTVPVSIVDNSVVDANRSFSVQLTGPSLGAVTTTTVTIQNDDQPAKSGGGGGGGALASSSLGLLGILLGLGRRRRQ